MPARHLLPCTHTSLFPSFQLHSSSSLDLWVLFFGYSECLQASGLVLSSQKTQCLHLGRGGWARVALVFCKVDPRGRAVVTHRAKERGRPGWHREALSRRAAPVKQVVRLFGQHFRSIPASTEVAAGAWGPLGRVLETLRTASSWAKPPRPADRAASLVQRLPPRPGRQVLASSARLLRALPAAARPPSPRRPPLHPPQAAVGRARRPPPPASPLPPPPPVRRPACSVLSGARGGRLDSARLRPWPRACAASRAAASGCSWVSRLGSRLWLGTRPRAEGASLRGRGGFCGVAGARGAGASPAAAGRSGSGGSRDRPRAPWPPAAGRFRSQNQNHAPFT